MKTKKDLIISAGIKLFGKFGPRRTSIDQIVTEADVAKGTFYLYFKNKEELYESIIDGVFSYGNKKGKELIKAYPDLKERILVRLILSLKFFEKDEIIRNIVFGNKDFFIGKIDKNYIENIHLKLLKSIFADDETLDYKLLARMSTFYINVLNIKEQFDNDKDFEKFTIEFAGVIVNGLFSDYKGVVNNLDYNKIKI